MSEKEGFKYFPVEVDLDRLFDWSQTEQQEGKNGARVTVNKKELAVFKYGDGVIVTDAVCPHAGGSLQAWLQISTNFSLYLNPPNYF